MSSIMRLHTPHFSTTTLDIIHTEGLLYVIFPHTCNLLFDPKISVWAGFFKIVKLPGCLIICYFLKLLQF